MRHLLAGCFGILCITACNDATAPIPKQSTTSAIPVAAASADVWAGHYIVLLKAGAPSSEALVNRHSFSSVLKMDQKFSTVLHGFSAAVSDADLASLRADPDVESVEPDRFVHQLGSETGMGWALDRVDQHAMPLNGAFAYGATGAGVNIYVVDGGIRYTHTEFGGRAHFAYDALGGNGSDCNGHGTGVAGIAAGSVHGVAKAATIWSVRVFPCSGTSTLSTILAGVDWVTAHHKSPAIANLSLGAAAAPILDTAVERSIRSGVTYVTAGGNNGGDACAMSPGKLKDVINVGATDASDSRVSWSNYGSCISMFAPGVSVSAPDYYSDVSLASWNGTSMSAPMVSGAVALYLQGHPTATPATVRSAMLGNATASIVKNPSGSSNRLLYTAWIGTVTPAAAPAAPVAPAGPPVAPVIPSSVGAAVSYKCASKVCAFDAAASKPTAGVATYSWTAGDGATSTASKWTHTYAYPSTYTWSLKIVDKAGHTYTTSKAITPASASGSSTSSTVVPPAAPKPPAAPPAPPKPPAAPPAGTFTANFTAVCVWNHVCTFDATSSTIPNGVSSFNWTLGDGYQATYSKVVHSYSGAKTVSVTLKIYDKKMVAKSITKTVAVH